MAEAFPPTDDGQTDLVIGGLVAEEMLAVVGKVAVGRGFLSDQEAKVKTSAGSLS